MKRRDNVAVHKVGKCTRDRQDGRPEELASLGKSPCRRGENLTPSALLDFERMKIVPETPRYLGRFS